MLIFGPFDKPSTPAPLPADRCSYLSALLQRWGLPLLPFLFFLARVVEYVWVAATPEQILWCCHLSNLGLAWGLAARWRSWIRVTSLWLIIGLLPWLVDMLLTGLITPVSIFSHLGGGLVALIALRHVGLSSGSWKFALLFFLLLQQLTRFLTEPGSETNVNLAHSAYGPWKDLFQPYWLYLTLNTLALAFVLWLSELLLQRLGFRVRLTPASSPSTTLFTKQQNTEGLPSSER
jgi:hypothetical protein